MSNIDDAKGRAKEAVGAVTGDDEKKNEGKADQLAGKAEHLVDEAADKIKGVFKRD